LKEEKNRERNHPFVDGSVTELEALDSHVSSQRDTYSPVVRKCVVSQRGADGKLRDRISELLHSA
jgi:hypothetical protein